MELYVTFAANTDESAGVRTEYLEGEEYLVAKGAILGDDSVLHGSNGPGLYPAEENKRDPEGWNGRFLTANHPVVDGKPVSACTPEMVDKLRLGMVFNTVHADAKVRPEFWFNVKKTKSVDKRIYEAVKAGKRVEMSTGLNLTVENKEGKTAAGKEYKWIARNYKPDHVAVLIDSVGAYSGKDGGGINVHNSLIVNEDKTPESSTEVLRRSILNAVKAIGVEGIVGNEMSFSQITRTLSDLLSSKYGQPGRYWGGYVCEVFPDYVIFVGENADEGPNGRFQKIGYTVSDKGVSLSGDAVPVIRSVTYTAANTQTQNTETKTVDKTAKINWIIQNSEVYGEGDRQTLVGYDDAKIDKLYDKFQPKAVTPPPTQTPAANATTTVPPPAVPLPPPSPAVQQLTPQEKSALKFGIEQMAVVRNGYIQTIKANPNNKFTDEHLNGIEDLNHLAALAELAKTAPPVQNKVVPQTPDMFVNGWHPTPPVPASYIGQATQPTTPADTSKVPVLVPAAEPVYNGKK